MRPTIKDIAKKAGVSHTTVSRALNGDPSISTGTCERVCELAEEMGYLGSAAARGLRTNRSKVIGVIVSRIDNPYFGEIIQGIEETLNQTGYSLFIASSHLESRVEKNIIKAFARQMVDGVIICASSFCDENAAILRGFQIPVVALNNECPEKYVCSVEHDDIKGAQQVTRYLIQLGHRRLAYLGNSLAARINDERQQGFISEINKNGFENEPHIIFNTKGREIENGEEAMKKLLEVNPLPTAVFCFNDLMAIGALKTANDHGLKIPEDISIVGFDNIPYSAYTSPALTTFNQPKYQIGQESTNLLLESMEHFEKGKPNFSDHRRIQGSLLIRQSTGIPYKRIEL